MIVSPYRRNSLVTKREEALMSRFIRKNPYQKVPAIPPFLRNHLWQPLKALLASLELWLLIPITLHSPDGVRSMFTVATE